MASKRQTSAKGKTASKKKGTLRNLKAKKQVNDDRARSIKGSGWSMSSGGDRPTV
jgi:hypothetical protein